MTGSAAPVSPAAHPQPRRAIPAPLKSLVWCGAVSIANLFALPIVMTFDRAGVEATIIADNPDLGPDQLEFAWWGVLAYSYGLHIVTAAVFVWLGWKVLKGRNWARVTLSVVLLGSIGAGLVSAAAGTMYLWAVIVSDVTFVLGLVLLWAPASSRAHFRSTPVDSTPNAPSPPEHDRCRPWISVTVFAIVSIIAAGALLRLQPLLGLSMEVLSLVMLAPAIGALVVWLTVRRHLPRGTERVSRGRFAAAIGLSIITVVIYFVAIGVIQGRTPEVPTEVAGMPVVVLILAQFLGALTEEIGFRGVLFQGLNARMSRLTTSIVVGLVFGLWHVQYFALPIGPHAAFVLGTVALTVTMAYVMVGSFWQRMIVCTIIHLGANLALAFAGGEDVPIAAFGLAVAVGCLIMAPIAILLDRGAKRETV